MKNDLQEHVMVVRRDLSFSVGIRYGSLPAFCISCVIMGHSLAACRFRKEPDGGNDKQKKLKALKDSVIIKDKGEAVANPPNVNIEVSQPNGFAC